MELICNYHHCYSRNVFKSKDNQGNRHLYRMSIVDIASFILKRLSCFKKRKNNKQKK